VDAQFDQIWDTTDALDPEIDYKDMAKENQRRWPNYPWSAVFDDVERASELPWYDPVWQRPAVKIRSEASIVPSYKTNDMYTMHITQRQQNSNIAVPMLLEDTESIDEEMEMAMSSPDIDPTSTIIEQRPMTYSTVSDSNGNRDSEDHPSKRAKYDPHLVATSRQATS
jgi:hypothetical protein